MNVVFYIVNGMVMPPAMFFAWNFYKFKGNEIKFGRLWIGISILSINGNSDEPSICFSWNNYCIGSQSACLIVR
jgi:hypothetical protein